MSAESQPASEARDTRHDPVDCVIREDLWDSLRPCPDEEHDGGDDGEKEEDVDWADSVGYDEGRYPTDDRGAVRDG